MKRVIKNFTYNDLAVYFLGPDLSEGELPALFYFALSAHESLSVDPYNQPVEALCALPLRIFSFDIPGHGTHLSSHDALSVWAQAFEQGNDLLSAFTQKVAALIVDLQEKEIIAKDKCAVAGLSRGAFIATHVAALCPAVRAILGFAPLTKLSYAKEFHHTLRQHALQEMDLENCIPQLMDRSVRFYIGNCDKLVNTRFCFDFIEKLANAMDAQHIRSPQAELILTPSVGFQGHGTLKPIFHQGGDWIADKLGVTHAS